MNRENIQLPIFKLMFYWLLLLTNASSLGEVNQSAFTPAHTMTTGSGKPAKL